ncbi:MAG: MoaD/ThiS family protein [Bowdeniella nasicola]|nr:MoaD/ThiS family protein [Bowdeniella nasicola]
MITQTVVTVRYFAGAAEAAGTHEDHLEVPRGATLADLAARLAAQNERLARVIDVASFVVDGVVTTDRDASLNGVDAVDVLPPFAGG